MGGACSKDRTPSVPEGASHHPPMCIHCSGSCRAAHSGSHTGTLTAHTLGMHSRGYRPTLDTRIPNSLTLLSHRDTHSHGLTNKHVHQVYRHLPRTYCVLGIRPRTRDKPKFLPLNLLEEPGQHTGDDADGSSNPISGTAPISPPHLQGFSGHDATAVFPEPLHLPTSLLFLLCSVWNHC